MTAPPRSRKKENEKMVTASLIRLGGYWVCRCACQWLTPPFEENVPHGLVKESDLD